MVKRVIEVSEFKNKFAPKTAIQVQELAYFIVDNSENGVTKAVLKQPWDEV